MNVIFILISSAFYILSFPTTNCWWLSFIALVPFLKAIEKSKNYLSQIIYGAVWSIAIASGLGYWLFYTLCKVYHVPIFKAILFFGLFVFLPIFFLTVGFIFVYCFMHRDRLFFYALILPSLWTLMDYIKEAAPILIPWGEIGYTLIPFHSFIQAADIVGIYGITFIVVMINGLIYYVGRQIQITGVTFHRNNGKETAIDRINWSQIKIPSVIIILAFILPVIYGTVKLKSLHDEIGSKFLKNLAVDAQLIQGNFSLMERWSGMGFYHRIQQYLEMTESGERKKRQTVIVWPETTLNSTTKVNDGFFLMIMQDIGKDAVLISGGLKEDKRTGSVLNSAYIISGQGHLMRYDKHILLPYAETSPLIDLLGQYYTAPNQFQKGLTPLCFPTPNGKVGISICFEILYPKLIRQSVKEGAEFLVNISNDAWFGNSPMPYNHLNGARLRAIENRRYVLRTSNSGFSAIIGPDGNIIARSNLFTREQITGQFLRLNKMSLYTKYGDIILYLSAIFLLAALFRFIFKE